MSSEKTLVMTHNQSDYGAGEIAKPSQRQKGHMDSHNDSRPNRRTVQFLLQFDLRLFAKCLLSRLDGFARAIL